MTYNMKTDNPNNRGISMRRVTQVLCFCLFLLAGCTAGKTPIPTDTLKPEEIEMTETTAGETPMPTDTPKPRELETIRDIAYLADGLKQHTLDLYLPEGNEGPFPTLLMFHGGNGRKEEFSIWGDVFSRKGYAVVSINYSQWPNHEYPKNLEDAYCALSWVLKNSDIYQFDRDQIFFLGHSAGGTLAASLGVVDDRDIFTGNCPDSIPGDFQAAGIITFTLIYDYPTAALISKPLEDYTAQLLGGTYEELPEIWVQASPASWVNGNEPPFLLIHGEIDQSIPPSQSQEFAEILEAAGDQVELMIIPSGSHMQIKDSSQSMEAVESFLSRIITSITK